MAGARKGPSGAGEPDAGALPGILPAHLGHRHAESPAGEVSLLLIPIVAILLLGIAWDARSFIAFSIAIAATLYAWHLQGGFDRFAEAVIRYQGRFASLLERLGSVDILVNNAAGNFLCPSEDLSPGGFAASNTALGTLDCTSNNHVCEGTVSATEVYRSTNQLGNDTDRMQLIPQR